MGSCNRLSLPCAQVHIKLIVKVPTKTSSTQQITDDEILLLERQWATPPTNPNFQDGVKNNVRQPACDLTLKITFENSKEYCQHFNNLNLARDFLERSETQTVPRLETHLESKPMGPSTKWLTFRTNSYIHKEVFRRGVSVNVEIVGGGGRTYPAYVEDKLDGGNGYSRIHLKFSFGNHPPTINMHTNKISIGLEHDQTIFKRQQDALRSFNARPNDPIKLSILGQPSQVELHSKYFRTYQTYVSAPGQDLNSAQRDAVVLVMCWPLSLIQGPPGTGKTHTIVAMVLGLLKKSPQTKVLCCAPSNDPTDHLAVQLAKYLPEYEVTRVTSGQVVHEDLQEDIRKLTLKAKVQNELRHSTNNSNHMASEFQRRTLAERKIIQRSNIICVTCNVRKSNMLARFCKSHFAKEQGPQTTALLAVDTSHFHEASDGTSLMNGPEARLVLLIVTDLLHRGVRAEDIGIITFYNGQRGHLENLLERHHCIPFPVQQRIMIDSVDAFQGREKDFIILSCVRSGNQRTISIGFLRDPRRINVAITRAKKGVVIMGNLSLLRKDRVWSNILSYYPEIKEDTLLDKLGGIDCAYCFTGHIVLDSPDELSVVGANPTSSLTNNFWLRDAPDESSVSVSSKSSLANNFSLWVFVVAFLSAMVLLCISNWMA